MVREVCGSADSQFDFCGELRGGVVMGCESFVVSLT